MAALLAAAGGGQGDDAEGVVKCAADAQKGGRPDAERSGDAHSVAPLLRTSQGMATLLTSIPWATPWLTLDAFLS